MKRPEFLHARPWSTDWLSQGQPLEFLWAVEVAVPPEKVWPLISDTQRFNREFGFGPREHKEQNGVMHVRDRLLGFVQAWVEEPWEWIENRECSIERRYQKGAAKAFRAIYHLEPVNGGTRVWIYLSWIPGNWLWRMALRIGVPAFRRRYVRALAKIENFYKQQNLSLTHNPLNKAAPKNLPEDARARLSAAAEELKKRNFDSNLVDRLTEFLAFGDEILVQRIEVLRLAKEWQVNEEALLKLCLNATRLGILNLSWDVLCPHCRGTRQAAGHLAEIAADHYCDVCEISFDVGDPNLVEVTFRVHPSIREIQNVAYCAAEAAKKPHIKSQIVLPAGAERQIRLHLSKGEYRVRMVGRSESVRIHVANEKPETHLSWDGTRDRVEECGSNLEIFLRNGAPQRATFVCEEFWWHREALKPGQLFSLREFRDLFSQEHLAADVKLNVGEQTILFTDVVGSTQFYEQRGDGLAFVEVRKHFQMIFAELEKTKGTVVKTIGDAVMAAFSNPSDAFAAALAIHRRFPPVGGESPFRIRISIHVGPVLAVALNTGIDYFGGVVNFCAKLQACAGAGEIALSDTLCAALAEPIKRGLQMTQTELKIAGKSAPSRVYVIDTNDAVAAQMAA